MGTARTWVLVWLSAGMATVPLAGAEGFTDADYAQHVHALKKKLPAGHRFTILIQPPFIVIGDEPPATVRRRATETVKFAVDRLKRDYFEKDPAEIIDVWLFKDEESYQRNTKALFNTEPTTPFGFFSSENHALIMNIATGGGTLVHEIVHPFVRANFPQCPPWFNEGLGSLYEQCADRDGHIHGLTNWRLRGLQEALAAQEVPSFAALTALSEDAFYGADSARNYAQARYLCYYLQEKGLLVKFYHAFVAAREEDPTGYQTLQVTLGEKDMAALQQKWESFVRKLTFP